jgi:type II secretory pathway component PulL
MKTGFIDWTEDALNFYAFEKRAGQYYLVDSTSFPLEEEPGLEALESLPSAGCGDICLSVPLNLLTIREQTFPFSDKDKIRDTIPFELEGILLGSISDYVIDHIIIESYEVGSRVLAVCMEKSKLKKIIDMFSSAGLEPKSITSLDSRLCEGKSEVLLEATVSDPAVRAEAARQEISEPLINLRRNGLAYMGDVVKFVGRLRLTAVLILILMIVLAANFTLSFMNQKKENKLLTDEIEGVYRQVFPEDKKIIDADRQFKGNMNMLLKKKAALGGVPVLHIIKDIAEQNIKNVTLHEFNTDGKNIIIKGTANSFEDVEALKNNIAALYKEVKVTDSGATADKKINFTIVMQEKTS